jgi:hypothetical protein
MKFPITFAIFSALLFTSSVHAKLLAAPFLPSEKEIQRQKDQLDKSTKDIQVAQEELKQLPPCHGLEQMTNLFETHANPEECKDPKLKEGIENFREALKRQTSFCHKMEDWASSLAEENLGSKQLEQRIAKIRHSFGIVKRTLYWPKPLEEEQFPLKEYEIQEIPLEENLLSKGWDHIYDSDDIYHSDDFSLHRSFACTSAITHFMIFRSSSSLHLNSIARRFDEALENLNFANEDQTSGTKAHDQSITREPQLLFRQVMGH